MASEIDAGNAEACSEHHKMKKYASQSWQTLIKKYWCLTYVVLNGFYCSLSNQIPQVSCWIAQRHNDQKHQNKDNLQVTQKGSQTGSEIALRQFCE